MSRDASEFCSHALSEFLFLREAGFSELHTAESSQFSIEFVNADSRGVGIGAFLPRYEYFVSLRYSDSKEIGLDELAAVVAPDVQHEEWTWAHSDSDIFKSRISYSATLLQQYISLFLDDDGTLWDRVHGR